MNSIKLTSIALILGLGSSLASAHPCDGFQVKVKNDLSDDLLASSIKLDNANISPGGIQKLDKKTEQTFTVNNSAENATMAGEFVFRTISLPSKKVSIKYTLENKGLICHINTIALDGDYFVSKTRLPGHNIYTIHNG